MPFGGGFFHSSLKVKKNISVSMGNFKRFNWYSYLFSLSSRHYWIQPKSLCPTKPELSSATWHDYLWFKFWRAHLEIHFLLFTAFIVPHLFYFSTLLTPQLLQLLFLSSRFSVRDFSCPVLGGHTQNCHTFSFFEPASEPGSSLCNTGHLWMWKL